jgi:hypothetical protein
MNGGSTLNEDIDQFSDTTDDSDGAVVPRELRIYATSAVAFSTSWTGRQCHGITFFRDGNA